MSVKRDLQNAAAFLRAGGWSPLKHRHAIGAIMLVTKGMGAYLDARGAFTDRLGGWDAAQAWENAPGRTGEEVIAALEAAAEAAPDA